MKLTFLGADHEVTGSCHYLEVGDKKMTVDYGMEQGINVFENAPLPVPEMQLDYVFLTHAHVDHTGMLPKLCARGFNGRIYATKATCDLCSIMLRDCAHIQMQEAEWRNRKNRRAGGGAPVVPVYTMQDADSAIRLLTPCEYGEIVEVSENIKIRFTDVGHLLGSASIEMWLTEDGVTKKIVFSGDIGNFRQPLLRDPQKTAEADYVVMESTYGDRLHPAEKIDFAGELAKIIKETLGNGGNVVIPSFAIGRTQEILYFIRQIKQENMLPELKNFPVYVDSPLAVEATEIFNRNEESCFDEEALKLVNQGINPLRFPGLHLAITGEESKMINFDKEPKVIISASGMCDAGRIRHHLKHNLWREENTVLFVGYQSAGTLGRVLIEGTDEVKLFGETITVRAKITQLKGLSGHADQAGLIDWVSGFEKKPRRVFVVHGEDGVCTSFAGLLHHEHGFTTYAPYSGTEFDLLHDKLLYEASPIPVQKKVFLVSSVYERLVAAGKRLMAVIEGNQGGTNKDLAKFADQINALCDKWVR